MLSMSFEAEPPTEAEIKKVDRFRQDASYGEFILKMRSTLHL